MTHLLIGFVIALSSTNAIAQKKMSIAPLKMMDTVIVINDQGKIVLDKFDYFLMRSYKDNEANVAYLDNFVKKNKDIQLQKYADYHVIFYKETDETNIKNINAYTKKKGNYYQNDNDLIYDYNCTDGKSFIKFKYFNGKLIEPKSNVIIKPVPIPVDSTHH